MEGAGTRRLATEMCHPEVCGVPIGPREQRAGADNAWLSEKDQRRGGG